jgi:two-component system, chemotaxis family, response regulator Rcp1
MSSETYVRCIDILLVEDNPGDVRLTKETLKNSKIHNNVNVVTNGDEALAYLYRRDKYLNAVRPDLILLDLNLPKKGGQEVLAQIKEDPELKHIPIVILTSSKAEEDILKTYNLHANCYVSKPVVLEQFCTVVNTIESFWLSIVKLPKGVHGSATINRR